MSYIEPRRGVGLMGLGSSDFNAPSVWSDWVAGSAGNASAGKRAGQAIQNGLNSIGYGPIAVDGQFGSGSISAWNRFAVANGVPKDWPTQAGVIKLGEQLDKGGNQGGGGVQVSHIVDGQYIPGASASSTRASMLMGLGIVAVIGIGIIAIAAKKKQTAGGSQKKVETTMKSAVV